MGRRGRASCSLLIPPCAKKMTSQNPNNNFQGEYGETAESKSKKKQKQEKQ